MTQTVYDATAGADTFDASAEGAKGRPMCRVPATGVVGTGGAGPCAHHAAELSLS